MQQGQNNVFTNSDIEEIERILLPNASSFSKEGRAFLLDNTNADILACPGSGKTTLLLAKLYLLNKKMPFDNNEGICVLSHTNVAVNEIKKRLGNSSDKILGYPNFVGTIQSFINKFIAFPYLSTLTEEHINLLDDSNYAERLLNICKTVSKYSSLKYLIEMKLEQSQKYFTEEEVIKNMYIENSKLMLDGKCISGIDKKSTIQFIKLKDEAIKKYGLIRYKDAYSYSEDALNAYGSELKHLIAKRFKYVFVDEYQDCSSNQTNVIDSLFTNTILQKIGDIDQAIYSDTNASGCDWVLRDNILALSASNRYHQQIADIINPLCSSQLDIVSNSKNSPIMPTLIIFNNDNIKSVIPTFKNHIIENGLCSSEFSGSFKAIGMIRNGSGLKISDYIDGNPLLQSNYDDNFEYYITLISEALSRGNINSLNVILRKLILKICFILKLVQNGTNRMHTLRSVRSTISNDEEINESYKKTIVELLCSDFKKVNNISKIIRIFILDIFEEYEDELSDFLNSEHSLIKISQSSDCGSELDVELSTVHQTKGETHLATLYLETEFNRSSDIKRILPLFKNQSISKWTSIHEKSRKVVYVGLSRPSHLLCLAVRESTYKGNESAFQNWNKLNLYDYLKNNI